MEYMDVSNFISDINSTVGFPPSRKILLMYMSGLDNPKGETLRYIASHIDEIRAQLSTSNDRYAYMVERFLLEIQE